MQKQFEIAVRAKPICEPYKETQKDLDPKDKQKKRIDDFLNLPNVYGLRDLFFRIPLLPNIIYMIRHLEIIHPFKPLSEQSELLSNTINSLKETLAPRDAQLNQLTSDEYDFDNMAVLLEECLDETRLGYAGKNNEAENVARVAQAAVAGFCRKYPTLQDIEVIPGVGDALVAGINNETIEVKSALKVKNPLEGSVTEHYYRDIVDKTSDEIYDDPDKLTPMDKIAAENSDTNAAVYSERDRVFMLDGYNKDWKVANYKEGEPEVVERLINVTEGNLADQFKAMHVSEAKSADTEGVSSAVKKVDVQKKRTENRKVMFDDNDNAVIHRPLGSHERLRPTKPK